MQKCQQRPSPCALVSSTCFYIPSNANSYVSCFRWLRDDVLVFVGRLSTPAGTGASPQTTRSPASLWKSVQRQIIHQQLLLILVAQEDVDTLNHPSNQIFSSSARLVVTSCHANVVHRELKRQEGCCISFCNVCNLNVCQYM